MKDPSGKYQELTKEISALKQKIKELEQSESEHKRASEALRESEEYFKAIIQNSSDIILVVDRLGTITYASPSIERFLGYGPDELIGKSSLDLIASDDKTRAIADFGRAQLVKEVPTLNGFRIRHKNGTQRILEGLGKNLLDNPIVKGFVINVRDVTERKQAEEKLHASEEKYRSILENIEDGYFEVDLAGNMTFFNPSLCRILGYPKEEMLGMNNRVYMDAENAKKVFRAFNEIYAAGIPTKGFEWETIRKDGSIVYLDVSVSIIAKPGGKATGFRGIARDITERKRIEEAERRTREEAERLAGEMSAIAEIGRVISFSLVIDDVYERFAAEVKKLIPFDRVSVNLINPDGKSFTNAYVSGLDLPERRPGTIIPIAGSVSEIFIQSKSGRIIHVENSEDLVRQFPSVTVKLVVWAGLRSLLGVPLIYRDEAIGTLHFGSITPNAYTDRDLRLAERIGAQIAGAIANAQQFSERKRAEEETRSLQERLQRAEKMEALGQLAGGVAHDLNNVLGVLTGYSELLLGEIPEGQRARGYAEKILQSTEKGATIIQDLLTLARRGVTASEVINLNSVVSDFLKTPVFEKIKSYHPHVTFRTEYDRNLLNIKGSLVHLEKTVMNLMSNAAEAISGKGEVTIRTESRYIDKPVRGYDEVKEGDYAVLTASDTGMGIPAESIEKIFEPFYTKKTMGRSGTGLGLAIVWGTVKDHNGYIDVQTEVERGTIFTLYFPVTREEVIAQQQKVPIEQYIGKGELVLVVDDIAEQREIATNLLTRLGYQVHMVSGGEEAVEYLKSNKADILVLDMIMDPGIDGLETYKKVLEINPTQKAIIVSGFSETERVKEAQRLGAGAYVKKPYVTEKIGVAIRDELGKK